MNTPKPCDSCGFFYFDCTHEDDPSYCGECKLGLAPDCKSYVHWMNRENIVTDNRKKKNDTNNMECEKLEQLKVAIQDLLAELRIDKVCLSTMSNGLSPDYPGAPLPSEWSNPKCKIQISQTVAKKLIEAGVLEV